MNSRLPLSLAAATVGLSACQLAPSVRDDQVTMVEDQVLVIDVLENDDGVDEVDLTQGLETPHGQLRIVGRDKVEYTPEPDFVGEDHFLYTGLGEGGSNTAVVTVMVTEDLPRFAVSSFPVKHSPMAVASADFDANGQPDIALLSSDDAITFYMQVPPTGAAAPTFDRVELPALRPDPAYTTGRYQLTVRDMNGDGRPDVLYASPAVGIVVVGMPAGASEFETSVLAVEGSAPERLVVGDFDGNGLPDMVLGDYWQLSLLQLISDVRFEDGTLTYTRRSELPTSSGAKMHVIDFTGDGVDDLLVDDGYSSAFAFYTQMDSEQPVRSFFGFNSEVGPLRPVSPEGQDAEAASAWSSLSDDVFVELTANWRRWIPAFEGLAALCDIDSDGSPELALIGASGVRFWGEATTAPLRFAPRGDISAESGVVHAILSADINLDGLDDMLVTTWDSLELHYAR